MKPLSGRAFDGAWRIGASDRADADGRLAICAIVKRSPSTPLNFVGTNDGELIGTGFYLVPNGGFVTAKHVALEALETMSQRDNCVGLVYLLSNGLLVFRPIWRFFVHDTADLAFGIPHYLNDNKTGAPYRAKVLTLNCKAPPVGARISTWAYPQHIKVHDGSGNTQLQFKPAFYDGILEEVYTQRGPARKIEPPYYQTNIHLHGGASGGPVFNEAGQVFGVASCSFEGAVDLAFVTPIEGIVDIELDATDMADGNGPRKASVSELALAGYIGIGEQSD